MAYLRYLHGTIWGSCAFYSTEFDIDPGKMSFEFIPHFIIMKWSIARRDVLARNLKRPFSVDRFWKFFHLSMIRGSRYAVVWATRLGVSQTMFRKFVFYFAFASLWGFVSFPALAEEPVEAYLDALQERGYTEVALRYLDRMAKSDLVSKTFQQEVPYRKGEFLVNAARGTKVPARRQKYLNQAQDVFDQFITNSPDHPDVVLARGQLGNILVERARSLSKRTEGASADSQQELRTQAFELYQSAYEALTSSKGELGDQYKSLVSNREPEARQKLKQVKSQYVTTYLMLGRVLFEQAKTVEDQDPALYREKLTEATKAFDEVATKYRTYSAGLYATLYEGECYQLLGEHQRALSYFKELLQNSAQKSPIVRRLKTTALARAIESWLETDPTQGPDRAIQTSQEWIKVKRAGDERTPAWKEFQLSLAKAHWAKSKIANGEKAADRALASARSIVQELARRKSDVQGEAQELLVAMGRGDAPVASVPDDPSEVASFEEASEAAKAALGAMKLSNATVKILTAQLKQIRNPERRQEMETKLGEAEAEQSRQAAGALALFQQADRLAGSNIDGQQRVRYYLAFLYYTLKDYRRAAVIASHTALQYPDSVAAKECANVAIAARQRLYQELPEGPRSAQVEGIAKLGELLLSKWPDDPSANAALTTLIDVSLTKGDIAQAQKYLARIPSDSPKRGLAELRLGQRLWSEYRKLSAADPESRTPDEVEQRKQQAQSTLEQGLEHSKGQGASESAIRGALALAKIYVDSGRSEDALDLLNDPAIGTMALIQSQSRWLQSIPGLDVDGYTTAIRAHIASAGRSRDSITAAEDLLNGLRDTLKDAADGQARMMRIYVSLAQDLERQLAVAAPDAQDALAAGFESFLKKAAGNSDDLAVLNWVAQTFYSMGNGLVQAGSSSPEAQRYFTEASKAYSIVLARLAEKPDALPAVTVQQIRLRQATALRQTGNYSESIELFTKLLAEKSYLNIQVEAAKTLQQWGTNGGKSEALLWAIQGHQRDSKGKNRIWGWGRIAKLVASKEPYRDIFHEARYNVAKCRYLWAQKQAGNTQSKALSRASADLLATQKLYGLGTKTQKQRYEQLMRAIQKSLGQPAKGFAAP